MPKGNDVITNVISTNQHLSSTFSMQIVKFKRLSFKLSVLFPPPERHEELALRPLHILTLFQTQKYNFSPPFSDQTSKIDTRFQTWRLDRKFVIIA